MANRAATLGKTDLKRVIAAAREVGAKAVEIRDGGPTIIIHLQDAPAEAVPRLDEAIEVRM